MGQFAVSIVDVALLSAAQFADHLNKNVQICVLTHQLQTIIPVQGT